MCHFVYWQLQLILLFISWTCHFVILSTCFLCWLVILSASHFVYLSFHYWLLCQLVILLTSHFIKWLVYQLLISSKSRLICVSFCQLVLLCQLVISSTCHFFNWLLYKFHCSFNTILAPLHQQVINCPRYLIYCHFINLTVICLFILSSYHFI
jgi:hypothetical protein